MSFQVQAAKLAQRYEDELTRYPKARVLQLQDDVLREEKRTRAAEQRAADLGMKLSEARDIKQELREFYAKLDAIAAKINGQMVPQTETIVQLKLKMMELYQKLGASAIQAEYHTLV